MASQATRSLKTIVGQNLAVARKAKGLKQREAAEALSTDVMQLSKWERGIHRPADHTLLALGELYGRDYAWFFTDHDSPSQKAAA